MQFRGLAAEKGGESAPLDRITWIKGILSVIRTLTLHVLMTFDVRYITSSCIVEASYELYGA